MVFLRVFCVELIFEWMVCCLYRESKFSYNIIYSYSHQLNPVGTINDDGGGVLILGADGETEAAAC